MTIHPVLAGLIPSIVVGLIFWWVMRAVLRADRNERMAIAEAEAAATEKAGETSESDANQK